MTSDILAGALPDPPPGLGPEPRLGAWDEAKVRATAAPMIAGLDPRRADALLGAILLWHDHLEAAHALCQRHEGDPDADWLHAIMHRREPDPDNSRYWFARVGEHPSFAELAAVAAAHGLGRLASDGRWRAAAMVAATVAPGPDAAALVAIQATEIRLLARHLLDG